MPIKFCGGPRISLSAGFFNWSDTALRALDNVTNNWKYIFLNLGSKINAIPTFVTLSMLPKRFWHCSIKATFSFELIIAVFVWIFLFCNIWTIRIITLLVT